MHKIYPLKSRLHDWWMLDFSSAHKKKFILKLLQHHNCDAVLIGMANKTLTYSELMSTQMRVLFKIEFEKNQ